MSKFKLKAGDKCIVTPAKGSHGYAPGTNVIIQNVDEDDDEEGLPYFVAGKSKGVDAIFWMADEHLILANRPNIFQRITLQIKTFLSKLQG